MISIRSTLTIDSSSSRSLPDHQREILGEPLDRDIEGPEEPDAAPAIEDGRRRSMIDEVIRRIRALGLREVDTIGLCDSREFLLRTRTTAEAGVEGADILLEPFRCRTVGLSRDYDD